MVTVPQGAPSGAKANLRGPQGPQTRTHAVPKLPSVGRHNHRKTLNYDEESTRKVHAHAGPRQSKLHAFRSERGRLVRFGLRWLDTAFNSEWLNTRDSRPRHWATRTVTPAAHRYGVLRSVTPCYGVLRQKFSPRCYGSLDVTRNPQLIHELPR